MNKRQAVLILSFATIICYGYALGGAGALLAGRSEYLVIAAGLVGGSFCMWLAFRLWRQFLEEAEREAELLRQTPEEQSDEYGDSGK